MKKKTQKIEVTAPVGIVVSSGAERAPRLASFAYVWGPAPETAEESASKAA